MNYICHICSIDKKQKSKLDYHLNKGINKCRITNIEIQLEHKYEIKLQEQKTLFESQNDQVIDTKLLDQKTFYETKIHDLETKLKDKELSLHIALRESDYHIKSKDEQIIKLENHIKEMTNSLINKPTTTNQYNLHVTKTAEEYMDTKKGIHLNVLQCLQPK